MSGWRGKGEELYPERGMDNLHCHFSFTSCSFLFLFLCWGTPAPKNCAQRTVEVGGRSMYGFLYVCVALAHIPWG